MPTDVDLLKWFATLGLGGVLAAFIFMVYRKDIRNYTELWKATTDQLIQVIKDNTESNTRLVTLLEERDNDSKEVPKLKERIERMEKEREVRRGIGR